MLRILYEDNHLIAVLKPAGVLTQGDRSGEESLMEMVKKYLKEKYQKKGNVFLGLLHRLDRPVEGIVLFAKTSKGASRLSEQIRERRIRKIYHAIVSGMPREKRGILVDFLEKDTARLKARRSEKGVRAELAYETIRMGKKYSLVRIDLKTGKFHQIRAQFSLMGCPIAGDVKYGAPEALPGDAIALAETELSFETATTEEIKRISIPFPNIWENLLKE
jgi:23S rRNA pseudouridine1911/1915/1917 synthase